MAFSIVSNSEEETRAIGAKLGRAALPGDVVALEGALGVGKTAFVQGFAYGAGFKGAVVSPSFGLVRCYRLRRRVIHHLDLYRLSCRDLPNLALEEYFGDPRGICIVEWPEIALALMPADRLRVGLSHIAQTQRRLEFEAFGPRSRQLLGLL